MSATTAPTTAVLVVDMQNDNIHPEGAFASSGAAEHAQQQEVVANVRRVLDAARESGAAVFHNRIVVHPGRDVGGDNAPIFRMVGPDNLVLGTWGAEIVDGLDPRPEEIVLDRTRMSAFNGTNLDSMLRAIGATDVIVVGVWTNMAVEHTVRDAADHGYRVAIVSDATSSINVAWHDAALSFALLNIAEIATVEQIVERLAA
ncbi:cysteine hydrolase family protein [Microbacterium sp. NPDC055683]